jgi:hypoxanthine-guanine phosphoribosyltransferase
MNRTTTPNLGSATALWTPTEIAGLVSNLAEEVRAAHTPETEPSLIGVLPEAFPLFADFARKIRLDVPVALGFVTVQNLRQGNGHLIKLRGSFPNVEGREAVFFHTRVCSGATMRWLNTMAKGGGALSASHAALLWQPPSETTVIEPDHYAAHVDDPDLHIFGGGIDDRLLAPDDSGVVTTAPFETFYTRQLQIS